MRLLEERVEVGERAEQRVDGAVVADVVAEVPHRRGKDGGDPDRVDSELRQMLESLRNPVEIADAVAVRVLERPRIDLVDHGSLPPGVVCHGRSGLPGSIVRDPAGLGKAETCWTEPATAGGSAQRNGLPPVTATVVPDV